jgi:hypothetical protein
MIGLPVGVLIAGGGILLVVVGIVFGVAVLVLHDLASAEIRGWIEIAPQAVLRLAAARLPVGLRETVYEEEWLPELTYLLRGTESRPITRLILGLRFALGLFRSARSVARHADRPLATARPAIHVFDSDVGMARDEGVDFYWSYDTGKGQVVGVGQVKEPGAPARGRG